jgi:serine/threonine protein kinase
MLSVEDESMFASFEKEEEEDPSPRKVIDETRSIYQSRTLPKPKNGRWGLPVLCDFGEARIGNIQETGPFVQPHIYRSPEIVFEMPWGSPVDIWNVAALVRLLGFNQRAKLFSQDARLGTSLKANIYSTIYSTRTAFMTHSSTWPK